MDLKEENNLPSDVTFEVQNEAKDSKNGVSMDIREDVLE